MRMSFRLRWLRSSSLKTCSVQAMLATDRSVRGRRAGSAWLTWLSQRRRAGAGSHRVIQRCVYCCHARVQTAAGQRVQPTPAPPKRRWWWEGAVGAILHFAPWHSRSCTHGAA